MSAHVIPRDPDYERRVRESFAKQAASCAGRTLTVVQGELHAFAHDDDETGETVALRTGTMMSVRDRPGLAD